MKAKREIKCPKCDCRYIVIKEYVITFLSYIIKDNKIIGEQVEHCHGDIIKVKGECVACKHRWTFRKVIQINCLFEEEKGIDY